MRTMKDFMVFMFIFKKYFDVKQSEQSEYIEKMKIKMVAWQKAFKKRNKMQDISVEVELTTPGECQELRSIPNQRHEIY